MSARVFCVDVGGRPTCDATVEPGTGPCIACFIASSKAQATKLELDELGNEHPHTKPAELRSDWSTR